MLTEALTETKDPSKETEYPSNLFEEHRDHANQWDWAALWQEEEAELEETEPEPSAQ